MVTIGVHKVTKTFSVPTVRRDTVREHALDFFKPRPAERLPVLEQVSFQVGRGESVGLMGRNGSGKSTLLKIIAGIYTPDRGVVEVSAPLTPVLELGVGFNGELDAVDNVFLLGTAMGMSLLEIRAVLDDIIGFAELERFARQKLQHFSSGMIARLAYAVAFTAARDVVLLDEIFAVGDAGFKHRCEERYRQLVASGRTVLLVSHDPRAIGRLCGRALLLEQGRIVQDGASELVAHAYLELLSQVPAQ